MGFVFGLSAYNGYGIPMSKRDVDELYGFTLLQ
jgi:hypothetical protein